MDHAIYTAMGAARQTLEQQSITANNLANASTPGFRAQLAARARCRLTAEPRHPHAGGGLDAGRRYEPGR